MSPNGGLINIQPQNERTDIREILQLYNAETITRTELTDELGDIREKYNPIKEEMLNAKAKALSELSICRIRSRFSCYS